MKKVFSIILAASISALLLSCAPVLRRDLMDAAARDIPLSELKRSPELYKGKLFVLGGIIVRTKLTAEGSLIETLQVPVDSRGYLKGNGGSEGRFLALYPKERGILEPMIFSTGRQITLAGEFVGTREGKIDEIDYIYPLFRIEDLYLWEEERAYYYPYPYFYDPFYDPFFFGRPFSRHRFSPFRW